MKMEMETRGMGLEMIIGEFDIRTVILTGKCKYHCPCTIIIVISRLFQSWASEASNE
jgi:hypothetical protein